MREKYFLLFTVWLSKINSFIKGEKIKNKKKIKGENSIVKDPYFTLNSSIFFSLHNLLILFFNKGNRLHYGSFGITKRLWKYHFQPNISWTQSAWTGSLVCRTIISDYRLEGWICWLPPFNWLHCFSKFIRFLIHEELLRNKHPERNRNILVFYLNNSSTFFLIYWESDCKILIKYERIRHIKYTCVYIMFL